MTTSSAPRRKPARFAVAALLLPMLAAAELAADCASQQYVAGSSCDPLVREADYLANNNRLLSSLVMLGQIPSSARPEDKLPADYFWRRGDYALFFGLGASAERSYRRVGMAGVPPQGLGHALLKLADFDYQHGHPQEAERILVAMHDTVPPERVHEWQSLYARVLMAENRYAEAAAQLPPDAIASDTYARYNRGIALLDSGQTAAGRAALNDVGLLDAKDDESASLRDKANLVLGYDYLRAGNGTAAIPVFERIRLDGPFSEHALLGLGWAQLAPQAATAQPTANNNQAAAMKRALVFWSELIHRDAMDPAVQEGMLAIPYSLAQLGAQAQAADYYARAITAFEQTGKRLDDAIAGVRNGRMLRTLAVGDDQAESGWTWSLDNVPDTPEAYYLHGLIAENRFQEALKNYRDLRMLDRKLADWSARLQQLQKKFGARTKAGDLAGLGARAKALRPRVTAATVTARVQLETAAVEELRNQKKINDNRIAEARLALAQLYDTAPRGATH